MKRDMNPVSTGPGRISRPEVLSQRNPEVDRYDVREASPGLPRSSFLSEPFVLDFFRRNREKLGWGGLQVLQCTVKPLKVSKTGGKSVFGFQVELANGVNSERVLASIVGVWRPDRLGKRIFRLLTQLWEKGFDGRDGLRICKPIAYVDEDHLLLMFEADGMQLERAFREDHDTLEFFITQAARWAAKLHATKVSSVRKSAAEEEVRTLKLWVKHLSILSPRSSGVLRDLVSQIQRVENATDSGTFALTHGDFHPENIFVDRSGITVTDFERSSNFDPASDLGAFLAQTEMKSKEGRYRISSARVDKLRDLFLDTYAVNGSSDVLGRVPVFEARTYLEVLHYVYWGLAVKLDRENLEFWVGRADECLKEVS